MMKSTGFSGDDGLTGDLGGPIHRHALMREVADAPASAATGYAMAVGDQFDGTVGSIGDVDWVGIDLVAGQRYVFTLWGRDGDRLGVNDTALSVYAPGGGLIAYNDDIEGAENQFSAVSFLATATGRHYIAASAFGSETGRYTIQAATNVYTVDQVASQIAEFGWGITQPLRIDLGTTGSITVNIAGLNAAGQRMAQAALEAWTYATGLQFVITTSSSATIRIDDNRAGAFAGPDMYNVETGQVLAASVNVASGWLTSYGSQLNSYSFLTYIHEIGHALGLGHMGPYDGNGVYANDALFANDSLQMSVMSYFSASDNTWVGGTNWIPVTPMIGDMAGIALLYGAAGPVHAGNTVWGANSNVGGYLGRIFSHMFDGVPADSVHWLPSSSTNDYPIGLTLRDTGGTDLLDLSTVTAAQNVDLRPGAISDIAGERGNLVIAMGTVIENLRTGAGNDRLTGNNADNMLTPGRGNDTVNGGLGTDTMVVNATRAATTVTAIEGGYRLAGPDGTDLAYGIEVFQFTDMTVGVASLLQNAPLQGTPERDVLMGTENGDLIYGYGGNDRLEGMEGNDTIHGGDGHDNVAGNAGNDLLYGGAGDDSIAASDGNDTVHGGADNDLIGGGQGDDSLLGEDGNDSIAGGIGNDTLVGGQGNDRLTASFGNDVIYGGANDDRISGSFGFDLIYGGDHNDNIGGGDGRDTIYGGSGDDTIGAGMMDDSVFGDDGNDVLSAGDGNDTVFGGNGNDSINGGNGNDVMTGGAGVDTFVFNMLSLAGTAVDRITDFENGIDRIRMLGIGGANDTVKYGALSVTSSVEGAVITFRGQTIIVEDVAASLIDQTDFLFA